jgi:hypothetical protein
MDDNHRNFNSNHRKVVSYFTSNRFNFKKRSHGTHVVGSILGSAIDLGLESYDSGTPKHNGMAPGAKVAFTDIFAKPGFPDLTTMFESAYRLGARIHTNSWGWKVDNSYTSQAHTVDSIAYQYPDYLILFAAGNDGEWSQHGATVGSPATCKNCLSVGAAVGSVEDAQESGEFPRLVIGDTEVPCEYPTWASRLHFSGSSILLQDFCQRSNRSLSGMIAVIDLALSTQICSLIHQVLFHNC